MRTRHDEIFHALHAEGLLMLSNCWDAGSARIAEAAGSKALATSSAAVAWSHGFADGSRLPTDLLLATVKGIKRVSELPLSVDIEDGYASDPERVAALVTELVQAGVVGINIEDGAEAPELLCRKIAAARRAAAAAGVNLYINARTDVYLRSLVDAGARVVETLRRAQLYKEAGASGLFVPGVREEADMSAIAAGCTLPLNVLVRPGFPSPERLAQLGVRRLSAGSDISETMFSFVSNSMRHFLQSGEILAPPAPTLNYPSLNALMSRSV
ncbi:isocitrate lyase/phosphoenolpyruvate mutase family protein [Vitiosangium sp. GDMCC 1.1324]|uniref:isocitrate lyase/PEP mutase family protein n=1 Tax=Vitiosangium sp. (strain GDMCC 1.1324) TaxID=2138576 RepID=UPI000D3CE953|nr:isocitrate lyase/phosphoenolpyruvate mutase family protein [Vitiosangium sp. GDMCC 1.1324]PTL75961.1 isocitrate lyase/phosphoenolpyruvate mutase family protein [Vitiosangium sp. GDMCC 1.1324]